MSIEDVCRHAEWSPGTDREGWVLHGVLRRVTEGGSQTRQCCGFLSLTEAVSDLMTEKSRLVRQSCTSKHEQVRNSDADQTLGAVVHHSPDYICLFLGCRLLKKVTI